MLSERCPCPVCFECCCGREDCANREAWVPPCSCEEPKPVAGDAFVQVLCGCGWGSLKMKASEVPERCPVCQMELW